MKPAPPPPLVELNDLRGITRSADRCVTRVTIEIDFETRFEWIVAGQSNLHRLNDRNDGRWRLDARMGDGVTDFEHDSAYAFCLPLIGLVFDTTYNHRHSYTAWVDPNAGEPYPEFKVPLPGYDPTKEAETFKCTNKGCTPKGHPMVRRFTPPFEAKLYRAVQGKRVSIAMGPVYPKEEDE